MSNTYGVTLQTDLMLLLEALQTRDIDQLLSECQEYAFQIIWMKTVLYQTFGKPEKSISDTLSILHLDQSTLKDTLLDELQATITILKQHQTVLQQRVGSEKQKILDLLASFQTISGLLDININDNITTIQDLLVDICENKAEFQSIKAIQLKINQLAKEYLAELDGLTRLVQTSLPPGVDQTVVESLTNPDGVSLNAIDSTSLNYLYNSTLAKHLRLALRSIEENVS